MPLDQKIPAQRGNGVACFHRCQNGRSVVPVVAKAVSAHLVFYGVKAVIPVKCEHWTKMNQTIQVDRVEEY